MVRIYGDGGFVGDETQPKDRFYTLIKELKKQLEISNNEIKKFEETYCRSEDMYIRKNANKGKRKGVLKKEWNNLAKENGYHTNKAIVFFIERVLEYINLINKSKANTYYISNDLEELPNDTKHLNRENAKMISLYNKLIERDKAKYNNDVINLARGFIENIKKNDSLYEIRNKEKNPFENINKQNIAVGCSVTFGEIFNALTELSQSGTKISKTGAISTDIGFSSSISDYIYRLVRKLDGMEERIKKLNIYRDGYKDSYLEFKQEQILGLIPRMKKICTSMRSNDKNVQDLQMKIVVINSALKVLNEPSNCSHLNNSTATIFKETTTMLYKCKEECKRILSKKYNVDITIDELHQKFSELYEALGQLSSYQKPAVIPKHFPVLNRKTSVQEEVNKIREEAIFMLEFEFGRLDTFVDEYLYDQAHKRFTEIVRRKLAGSDIKPSREDFYFPYPMYKQKKKNEEEYSSGRRL